jgi:hypothetical protein
MHLLLHIARMKSLEHAIHDLSFDPYEMEYDAQLRRLLMNSKAVHGNDLVVEELWLPSGRCRADVAVVNEELTGFEIKAGRDRLDRLPQQILEYDSLFRYSNIVTVPAHLREVEKMVPETWGVWVALGEGRTLRLRCLRPASANLRRDTVRMARLLTREECIAKLKALAASKGASKMSKEALAQQVGRALTQRELDSYLCECLKVCETKPRVRSDFDELVAAHTTHAEHDTQQEELGAFSLRHLAHFGVLGTGGTGDSPLANGAPARLRHASSPVNLKARTRLEELRAEFAEVAKKRIEETGRVRPTLSSFKPLGFFPANPSRDEGWRRPS